MSDTPVYGWQGQLGIDTNNPVTARFNFETSTLGRNDEFTDHEGIRGTLDHDISRVRGGVEHVGGKITSYPTGIELANLLPFLLWGTPSGTSYPISDTPSGPWFITVDKSDRTRGKVKTYANCLPDVWELSAEQGQSLKLDMDIVGQTEAVANANSFPSLSLDTGPYWQFFDSNGGISVGGSPYNSRKVSVKCEYNIAKDRYLNSQTLASVTPRDRKITVSLSLPYGDAYSLYPTSASGTAVILTFTNGAHILTLNFIKVAFPPRSVENEGRDQEEMLTLVGEAKSSASTASLVTTLANA